jgi:hypothetical protein
MPSGKTDARMRLFILEKLGSQFISGLKLKTLVDGERKRNVEPEVVR